MFFTLDLDAGQLDIAADSYTREQNQEATERVVSSNI
jgi:hypothetical protein